MDGVSIGHQLVEDLRTESQFLVVGTFFVEQSDGLTITALGIVILLQLPIQITQCQQQHTFLDAVSHRLLITLFIGGNGL